MKQYVKDCLKSFLIVVFYIFVLLCVMYVSIGKADFKSTFLIGEPEGRYISPYSTLSWLSNDLDDNWRLGVIGRINGDTHADIMARSTAIDFGGLMGFIEIVGAIVLASCVLMVLLR